MKTIAELKRRRDGLNEEIARREAEHESYMHAKKVAERVLSQRDAWSSYEDALINRENELRLKQAEALKTIPVRTVRSGDELGYFLGGSSHGQIISVRVGLLCVLVNGVGYKRTPCAYKDMALFMVTEFEI